MKRIRTRPPQERKMTIREARRTSGMLQVDLGRLVGLPQMFISFIENGRVDLPKKDRAKWEWALDAQGRIAWPD